MVSIKRVDRRYCEISGVRSDERRLNCIDPVMSLEFNINRESVVISKPFAEEFESFWLAIV